MSVLRFKQKEKICISVFVVSCVMSMNIALLNSNYLFRVYFRQTTEL